MVTDNLFNHTKVIVNKLNEYGNNKMKEDGYRGYKDEWLNQTMLVVAKIYL